MCEITNKNTYPTPKTSYKIIIIIIHNKDITPFYIVD
jgi:hypothetical protein